MRKYSEVVFEPKSGSICGRVSYGVPVAPGGHASTCAFSACLPLFAIDICMEIYPRSGDRFMNLADGYGAPGFFPSGYDWSGIRDSSDGSTARMFALAKQLLHQTPASQFALRGIPADLMAALRGRRR